MNLLGLNPNYNPPAPLPSNLQQSLSLGSTIYVYGWAAGVAYQQGQEIGLVSGAGLLCQSATSFNLVQTTTATFNLGTCEDVVRTLTNQLYQQSLSTSPVLGY